MKLSKQLSVIAMALGLTLALTACDPPMPEDVKITLAEKVVLCADGSGELAVPESIADLNQGWADSLASSCEAMQLVPVEIPTSETTLVAAPAAPSTKLKPFLSLPFALDAAVLVVNIPDVFEINLSAPTIIGIFDGGITNWNDPAISADNDGLELPDLKIVLPKQAGTAEKTALASWVERLAGAPLDLSAIADAKVSDSELALPVAEGAISIASYSSALLNGSSFAAILTKPADTRTAVLPATETIFSAATQLVVDKEATDLSLVIDAKLKPTAAEGNAEADLPYQAIFTVRLYLLGDDTELTRTLARFLLRQDSQGTIASGTMLPIPESARILAVKEIEKGLPKAAELPAN
jgi:phosphate transport system substrate-binding protein